MKYILIVLLLISSTFANEEFSIDSDFLSSLDEVSEIATKTKLNIDDTPSFVTVLHSNRLKKLGITNIFEALSLVPGVQLKKEISGVPVVVFRGVTQKGEVKLMVDGVSINNSYRGSIYYYLDFPIEMIDRIEVIRGASSILYGSGAISGVINIITKSSDKSDSNTLFVSTGTNSNHKGGALVSTDIGKVKIALDAYYHKSDKSVKVGANPSGLSGDSDRHLKDYSVGVNISDEHLSLLARVKKSDIGNAYGIFGVLDTDEDRYNNINNSIFTQLSYKNSISKNNSIKISTGYNRYTQIVKVLHPLAGVIDAEYKEDSYFSEVNLISTSLQNNELLLGAKYTSDKTTKSEWSTASGAIPPISDPKLSREVSSLYFNDIYSALPNFDLSMGLRYDYYSDFGNSYSPNIGLVYRVNSQLRIKALYSRAFRAPSWVELTSNPDLSAEESNSFETGIIFKQNQQNILRVNFYTITVDDMITKDTTGKYVQNSQNQFLGTELEYIYSPNYRTELNFLATYIKAEDDNGDDLSDVANILASTSLTYELEMGLTFGSLLKYVSSSKRSSSDTRDDMEDSFIFDQTLSYEYKDFTTTLIIKDLFDQGTYYALPSNSYGKDFDDGGRSAILNASIKF